MAGAGIVEIDSDNSTNLATRLDEIGLVLLLEHLTRETMAVADLSYQSSDNIPLDDGEVGLLERLGSRLDFDVSNGEFTNEMANLGMISIRQQLADGLETQMATRAVVNDSHVLEIERLSVVFKSTELAGNRSLLNKVVEGCELIRCQREGAVAEGREIAFAECCEVVE